MAKRVNLDAFIPREDFARQDVEIGGAEAIRDFPISYLLEDSPIRKQLRKPDFQRETTHWTPEQVVTFVASFLDQEVIPGLILWKSPSFIFVIDGGHRLSALRAWIEDDYGDRAISATFFGHEISQEQKKVAQRTRKLIEEKVGRFSTLKALVGTSKGDNALQLRRAGALFTRPLTLQWVLGSADVAETSFFKINSQGTPLDDVEEMLIKNRRKPIAISARAILRAGQGHKYWSRFTDEPKEEIERHAHDIYKLIFEPEVTSPIKTLDVPLAGSVSPVDALALLIDFLTVAAAADQKDIKAIANYVDDNDGSETVKILKRCFRIANRITGDSPGSLGLHPAVYFYNEKGKHSRFLFLGMASLITDKVNNGDDGWFKKFTKVRKELEQFLVDNKSLVSILPQNMSRAQRVPKMRDFFAFLVSEITGGKVPTPERVILHLGIKGQFLNVTDGEAATRFSDDTKSLVFIQQALASALRCKICGGLLDPLKSVSYDHEMRIRNGGDGRPENVQLVHPFCNTGAKA
jgi:Protein of unknown function DUF262